MKFYPFQLTIHFPFNKFPNLIFLILPTKKKKKKMDNFFK